MSYCIFLEIESLLLDIAWSIYQCDIVFKFTFGWLWRLELRLVSRSRGVKYGSHCILSVLGHWAILGWWDYFSVSNKFMFPYCMQLTEHTKCPPVSAYLKSGITIRLQYLTIIRCEETTNDRFPRNFLIIHSHHSCHAIGFLVPTISDYHQWFPNTFLNWYPIYAYKRSIVSFTDFLIHTYKPKDVVSHLMTNFIDGLVK